MNNRFDLPARNSIPVNEPGSAAYRRLQRAKKGRVQQAPTKGWNSQSSNVQRPVRGKQR